MYILRKEMDSQRAEQIIETIAYTCAISSLTEKELRGAAGLDFSDYEDAIQAATAQRAGADFIVTRNKKDFIHSPVPAISPTEFIERFSKQLS